MIGILKESLFAGAYVSFLFSLLVNK